MFSYFEREKDSIKITFNLVLKEKPVILIDFFCRIITILRNQKRGKKSAHHLLNSPENQYNISYRFGMSKLYNFQLDVFLWFPSLCELSKKLMLVVLTK